jgi:hypothetical protein
MIKIGLGMKPKKDTSYSKSNFSIAYSTIISHKNFVSMSPYGYGQATAFYRDSHTAETAPFIPITVRDYCLITAYFDRWQDVFAF